MHYQVLDTNKSLSERPLSDESREWLISQIKNKLPQYEFKPEDILKVPRSDGQYDLYLFNKTEVLGTGSNSQIYKAYPLTKDGEVNMKAPVAVKFVPVEKDIAAVEGLDRESFTLHQLGKKNFRFKNEEGNYLLMPYVPGKTIIAPYETKQQEESKQISLVSDISKLNLAERLDLLVQLGEQVQALHDNHVTHGDIQAANILYSKGEDNKITLYLVDYDQSRPISHIDALISPDTINMTLSIRAPEVSEKCIGAASDIYSLVLNFLFLLGQKDSFIPLYDMTFIYNIKKTYLDTPAVKAQINEYLESTAYKDLPQSKKENAERMFRNRLADTKYPKERLEKIWLDLYRPEIINLANTDIPIDINGIPLKQIMQKFFERMISTDPKMRPHIHEVNNFVRGIAQLIKNPSLQVTVTGDEKNKWETAIAKLGKKPVEEKKETPANPLLTKSHTQQYLTGQNEARVKLAVILDGMKNMGTRIDQKKLLGSQRKKKTPKRIALERKLKGIAELYDANSSKNPYKDYLKMVSYINDEIHASLYENKRFKVTGSDKHKALKQLLEEASNAKPPAVQSSRSSLTIIHQGKQH